MSLSACLSYPQTPQYVINKRCIAINVVLAFNMGQDINAILNSSVGQPMAAVSGIYDFDSIDFEPYQILLNSLGRKGMLATWSIVVVVQYVNPYYLRWYLTY